MSTIPVLGTLIKFNVPLFPNSIPAASFAPIFLIFQTLTPPSSMYSALLNIPPLAKPVPDSTEFEK